MKKALVVGANGFLGNAIVQKLIDENIEVAAIYNNKYAAIPKEASVYTKSEFFKLNTPVDYIFFACGNYQNTHPELIQLNLELLSYIEKFPSAKFVYISSVNVYGNAPEVLTEDSPYFQPTIYGQSKLAGEFLVASLPHHSIVRCTNLYGKGYDKPSFVPTIVKDAQQKGKIVLQGKGDRVHDYLHVKDAAQAIFLSALAPENRIYLAATGNSISNKKLAEEIAKIIPCQIEYTGEDSSASARFNPQKTFDLLRWKPEISLQEGLKEMLL